MNYYNLISDINNIPIKYFISAPAFIFVLFIFFYYWYLSVRECRRSRLRESTPLLEQLSEDQYQVY